MKQLDGVIGSVHEGVVNMLAHQHRTHRYGSIGQPFGERHDIGDDAEAFGGEAVTEAAEAGDDLIEYQQNAVLIADFAQALEIALGRQNDAGRTSHRFDDHSGNG